MTFDEKITEIMRNIGIAENTLMAIQLEIDAYETRATAAEAKMAVLREALEQIHERDRHWKTRSRQSWATGDTHYDDVLVLGTYAQIARAALETDNG